MKQSEWNAIRETPLDAEDCGRRYHVKLRPKQNDNGRGLWALDQLSRYINMGYGVPCDTKGPCLVVSVVRVRDWRLNVTLPKEVLDLNK